MNAGIREMIDRLGQYGELAVEEYTELIRFRDAESIQYLAEKAEAVRQRKNGRRIEFCGLIDLTNYCRKDCYYCGLRRENRFVNRYRMEEEDVLSCCETGYIQGIRSFLIQGGEDLYYRPEMISHIIRSVKRKYRDCQVILALGEKSKSAYRQWLEAGADGYILRYQTSDEGYFKKLHPANMSLLKEKQCLWEMKTLGWRLGTGFIVGTPNQTISHLAEELVFLKSLSPWLVMVGPFIPAPNTPFEAERSGNVEITCYLLSLLRLMLPSAVLPVATTTTILDRMGNVRAVQAGADLVLPDLSPREIRGDYHKYRKQMLRGSDGREGLVLLRQQLRDAGYEITGDNGQ